MVPVVEEPRMVPLTDHVSAGEEPSLVVAANCWVVLPWTLVLAGETVKVKIPGELGPLVPTTLAQPPSAKARTESKRNFERFTTVSLLEKSPRCDFYGTSRP